MGVGEKMENLIIKVLRTISKNSTPSQTAWAVMGLISVGKMNSKEVKKVLNTF